MNNDLVAVRQKTKDLNLLLIKKHARYHVSHVIRLKSWLLFSIQRSMSMHWSISSVTGSIQILCIMRNYILLHYFSLWFFGSLPNDEITFHVTERNKN